MLNQDGYLVFDLPPLPPSVRVMYEDLPADSYCKGRSRRFSQFHLACQGDGVWQCDLLPHRPHIQGSKFNRVVGGVLREFEPLNWCPSFILSPLAEAIPLKRDETWQVDVHQWRMIASANDETISVPEGPHQDGHAFAAIFTVDRESIRGGVTQLYHHGETIPFRSIELAPGQGVVIDDTRMLHHTTNIIGTGQKVGWRDVLVITCNTWENRHYGPEFERQSTVV